MAETGMKCHKKYARGGWILLVLLVGGMFWTFGIIGTVFLNDCPIDRVIPVLEIVKGCLGGILLYMVVTAHTYYGEKPRNWEPCTKPEVWMMGSVTLTLIASWIASCVFVFRAYKTVELNDATLENYCQRCLYTFSFWNNLLPFILILITSFYVLCRWLCKCNWDSV